MRLMAFILLLLPLGLLAQEETIPKKPKKYRFSGYVKYLQTTNFADGVESIFTDNLLHHRLNFRYWPHPNLTFAVEVRDRIHFGQLVQLTPGFAEFLDTDDIYDLSFTILDKNALVWHVMLDRAYMDYAKGKWQVTIGRQRINWGITNIWNPNDIFNAFNFYDFDYEERQGSDAVRLQYYTGVASSIEIAGKIATSKEEVAAALMWKFNKGQYDFQVLGGVAQEDLVLGGGWAGSLGQAGFKGEFSYFHPYEQADTFGIFTGSMGVDYMFKNSVYMNLGYLYNSNGSLHPNIINIALINVSAKNLSPYQHSFLVQASYPVNPLLNVSLANIYSPGDHALFLNPTLTYSIKENWSIDVLSQLFFTTLNGEYDLFGNTLFLRLKWSY